MAVDETLLDLLYDGVTDDLAWTAALAMVANAVRTSGAGLGVQDMKTHAFWAVAQSGVDPALHDTYQRLAPENRIWQEISRAGRPMADHMVLPKSEFLRSALYAEWFVPQGFHSVMAAPVMANGSHSGVVVTFGSRRRSDFDEDDLEWLGRLARHFSRALGLRLDRIRLEEELRARQNAFDELNEGVLLLDAAFKVRYANPAARTILNQRDGVLLRDGRLGCSEPRDGHDLQKALVAGSSGAMSTDGWIVVHRRDSRPLLVQVINLRGSDLGRLVGSAIVMVRIEDPGYRRLPTAELLRKLLEVTLGEAKVMLAVARTDSQEEAAAQLRVAKTTVRTQLHHAYQKLGIHDRAELLRLLAMYGFRHTEEAG